MLYSFLVGRTGNYYEIQRTVNQGSATLLEQTDTYYNGNTANNQIADSITTVDVAETLNGIRTAHTTTNYNALGYPTTIRQMDGKDNLVQLTTYSYDPNNFMNDLLVSDNAGQMISHTSYGIDETAIVATSGVPQHVNPQLPRGNQTSVHRWI